MTREDRVRLFDPIRIILTALVIIHHTAITYGGSGSWYYKEDGAPELTQRLLTIVTAVDQSFFMGFFFLLAGYFTPESRARKGESAYLGDRMWRLMFPMLVYGYLLEPLTHAFGRAAQGEPFWATYLRLLGHDFGLGPLWFNQALVFFAVGWCFLPRFSLARLRALWPAGFHARVAVLVVITAIMAFALRLVAPVGHNYFGMQIGYFASYVLLFVVGAACHRTQLLERITWRQASPWIAVSLIAIPAGPLIAVFCPVWQHGDSAGGWSIPAVIYAAWEPFVAAGVILGALALFRRAGISNAAWVQRLASAAFVAYIIHPPVIVATSWWARQFPFSHLGRFAVVAPVACVLTFLFADCVTRLLAYWKMCRCQTIAA